MSDEKTEWEYLYEEGELDELERAHGDKCEDAPCCGCCGSAEPGGNVWAF